MSRLCALILCLAGLLTAQTPDTATIAGQVVDATHAPIPGVEITVKNDAISLERRAVADSLGRFSIVALPVGGAYELEAVKSGFSHAHMGGLTLSAGATANLTLELAV